MDGMSSIEKKYLFIKIILIICLFIYIGMIFSMKSGSNKNFDEVARPLYQMAKERNLKKADAQSIKRVYQLNVKDCEGVLWMHSKAALNVEEVLLVKVKDQAQLDAIKKVAEERNKTELKTFEGYGAEQTKLLKNAVFETKGFFFFLAVSPDADAFLQEFKNNL